MANSRITSSLFGLGVRTGIALRIGTGRALRIRIGFNFGLGVGSEKAGRAGGAVTLVAVAANTSPEELPLFFVANSRFASLAFT